MAKIPLDLSGKKGLGQVIAQSLRGAYSIADGKLVDGVFNPFIRYGYLSPANATVDSVTVDQTQNGTFHTAIYDAVNDDFYFGESGQIFRGDTTGDLSLTRVVLTPGSNADQIKDLKIYAVNGARKIFAMYQNAAGNAEIAISTLPYDSATDDVTWLTATVSGGFTNTLSGDMFMQVSDNGFAYLFLENQVYKIDGNSTGGANGTITQALLFPNGFKMVDVLDFHGKMLIALHQYSNDTRSVSLSLPTGKLEVGVYIWDRQTTVQGSNDYISIPGYNIIHRIFLSSSGKIRLIATNTSGYVDMLEYNGVAFQAIQRIGYSSHPLFRDAVATINGMTCWFAQDGNLYAYGSLAPGDAEGLYKLYSTSLHAASGGVVLSATGSAGVSSALYLTYYSPSLTLTNSRLKIYTLTGQTGGTVTSGTTVTYPVEFLPKLSTVNFLRLFGAPCLTTGATTIATIKIYLNQATTQWASKTISLDQWSRGYIDIPINKPYVNSIQVEVSFTAGLTIGTSDFALAYGELDYTPSETNK